MATEMKYMREIIIHGDYFAEFYDKQTLSVQRKINYVLNFIRVEEKIPPKFFRNIENVAGLFEQEIKKATAIMKEYFNSKKKGTER